MWCCCGFRLRSPRRPSVGRRLSYRKFMTPEQHAFKTLGILKDSEVSAFLRLHACCLRQHGQLQATRASVWHGIHRDRDLLALPRLTELGLLEKRSASSIRLTELGGRVAEALFAKFEKRGYPIDNAGNPCLSPTVTTLAGLASTSGRFREVFPGREVFYLDPHSVQTDVGPFSRLSPGTSVDRSPDGKAGRVGAVFDLILRAQVSRWAASCNARDVEFDSSPLTDSSPAICEQDQLGNRSPSFAELSGRLARFEAGDGISSVPEIIDAAWVLAGYEFQPTDYRKNPVNVTARPTQPQRQELAAMWRIAVQRRPVFQAQQSARAAMALGFGVGAVADLVIDDKIVEIKTCEAAGYDWRHGAQLVAYFVIAAMTGEVWPIRKIGLYQARHGRMNWVDTAQLARDKDLVSFGNWLLTFGADRIGVNRCQGSVARLARNLAELTSS